MYNIIARVIIHVHMYNINTRPHPLAGCYVRPPARLHGPRVPCVAQQATSRSQPAVGAVIRRPCGILPADGTRRTSDRSGTVQPRTRPPLPLCGWVQPRLYQQASHGLPARRSSNAVVSRSSPRPSACYWSFRHARTP